MREIAKNNVGCLIMLLIVFMPPLAVIHKGIKPFIVTLAATVFGFWAFGVIVAAMYNDV